MQATDILAIARECIEEQHDADVVVHGAQHPDTDAKLELTWGQTHYVFHVAIKNELRNMQLPALEELASQHRPFLLVAHRLFPGIKEHLRAAGINFLEANGNMFIREDGMHIDIDRYPTLAKEKQEANRAFTKTGLKVVFQLLNDEHLINAPQRTIAEAANVALGNIPHILEGLLKTGYIVRKKQGFAWVERRELLQKWVDAFNTTLRTTLYKGRYTMHRANQWQNIDLKNEQTCWGGEPAADHYTKHLRPEELTMYTNDTRQELMVGYHLKPKENGEIIAYEKFWPQTAETPFAPPLLVYADLMYTANKRNLETAQLIFNAHLQNV